MNDSIPSFDKKLSFLDRFIQELVRSYHAQEFTSWGELDQKVKNFFTPKRLEEMEGITPGWEKMASYSGGITQTHVLCVFLGTFMLDEFQELSHDEKQITKWIVLFHDIDKFHIRGKKDIMHAFKSAVLAAKTLPALGFATTDKYHGLIDEWSVYTRNAYRKPLWKNCPVPNNKKLPKILQGIDRLFGENTPASLIIKVVLLHISIDADPFYPNPAPLSGREIKRFITPEIFKHLKIMILGDTDGWSLFEPEVRAQQYRDAFIALDKIEKLQNS